MTESHRLAPNKRKLLRRALHKAVYFLFPEQGLTKDDVPPFLASTAIVALVYVFRDPPSIRDLGLPRTADQLALWWDELTPHERSNWTMVFDRVAGAAAEDPALRSELLAFMGPHRLLSDRLSTFLYESPETISRRFAERIKEANKRARREIPRVMALLSRIVEEAEREFESLRSKPRQTNEDGQAE